MLKLAQGNLTRIDAAKQNIEVATAQINSINAFSKSSIHPVGLYAIKIAHGWRNNQPQC